VSIVAPRPERRIVAGGENPVVGENVNVITGNTFDRVTVSASGVKRASWAALNRSN
jgi:hypothetical protein